MCLLACVGVFSLVVCISRLCDCSLVCLLERLSVCLFARSIVRLVIDLGGGAEYVFIVWLFGCFAGL